MQHGFETDHSITESVARAGTSRRKVSMSLLMICLLLFVFFLPLRSVEIIGSVSPTGFAINFARLFSVIVAILVLLQAAVSPKFMRSVFRIGPIRNTFVPLFLLAVVISIVYYYLLASMGETVRFGSGDSFFRNWAGRPIAQALSLITYGIIPYYLTAWYAQNAVYRSRIERVFILSTLLIVYYGFFQQVAFLFGVPITGRNIFEIGRPITYNVLGVHLLRFHSLAGEPRDFAGYIIGALLLYGAVFIKKTGWFYANAVLMCVAFILALSVNGYLTVALMVLIVIGDIICRHRVRIRWKYIAYGIAAAALVVIFMRLSLLAIVSDRVVVAYQNITTYLGERVDSEQYLSAQAYDLAPYYVYIVEREHLPLGRLLFGYGYGNYLTPIAGVLKTYFHIDISEQGFTETGVFASKVLIEMGVLGVGLYIALLVRTLMINNYTLRYWRKVGDRTEYTRSYLMRLSCIFFFVSGALHTSYFFFIVMGLIVGSANELIKRSASPMVVSPGREEI